MIAFIAVILLVNLIRTRSFDYAWRIAIIAGGVVYVLMIIAGGFYFRLDIDVVTLIIYTVISVVIGLLLEFFVFGGDQAIRVLRYCVCFSVPLIHFFDIFREFVHFQFVAVCNLVCQIK